MIVCVCNRLRCSDIEDAIGSGARSSAEVHDHLGVQVQCGSCLEWVDDMIALSGDS